MSLYFFKKTHKPFSPPPATTKQGLLNSCGGRERELLVHRNNCILVNLHVSTCSTLSFVNYKNGIIDKGLETPDIFYSIMKRSLI